MIPILSETIDTCAICGDVCSERDLLYPDDDDRAALDLEPDDLVCRECVQDD